MQEAFMRTAIELAKASALTGEGGPFGAVVVKNGKIIGRGGNRVTSTKDPTAHAEIVAIRAACAALDDFNLCNTEIYCSCEPCPMCLAAIYWARIDRIYFAATRADAAQIGFDDVRIYNECVRPLKERSLPMTACLRGEALAAFRAWEEKADRIGY